MSYLSYLRRAAEAGPPMSRRGREASDRLTQALITMAAKGLRPHCSDPESHWMWLSEHPAERQLAALMCGGCPVISECGDAADANGERFGVWSGRDYTCRWFALSTDPKAPTARGVTARHSLRTASPSGLGVSLPWLSFAHQGNI